MADTNVYISGIAPGAINPDTLNLPPWATENTATKVQGILQKMYDLQSKTLVELVKKSTGAGGQSPEQIKKVNDELDKYIRNVRRENEEAPKKRRERKEEEDEHKKKKKNWKDLTTVSEALEVGLAAGAAEIGKTFKENFDTYAKLNEAGLNLVSGFDNVSSGFNGLQQLTALTGVRFTQLQESIQKYSIAVNDLGAGKFAKAVGRSSVDLAKFGFSAKESADLIGALLETQRGYTDVSRKSFTEVSSDALALGKNIFRLSLSTGMARQQILANMQALSMSTDANVYAGQVGEQTATDMTAFLGSFKNQRVAEQILKLLSAPIKPLNETFMNLQKVGMGGFATSFTNFTRSLQGMPEEMKQQALKSYIAAHRGELEANKQRLAMLAQAGVEGAQASLEFATALTQQADSIKPLNEKEVKQLEASNKARANLSSAWERLLSQLQRAFAPTIPMLGLLAKGLTLLSDGIEWLANKVDDTTKSWIGVGIVIAGSFGAIGVAAKLLGNVFGGLFRIIGGIVRFGGTIFNLLNPVAKLILVFTAAFAVGTLINEWISKFSATSTIFDALFSSFEDMVSSFASAFSAVGDMVSDAGKFLIDSLKSIGSAITGAFSWLFGGKESKPAGTAESSKFVKNLVGSAANASAKTEITVPKEPKASTIDSPSATPVSTSVNPSTTETKDKSVSPATNVAKPPAGPDLNDHLAHHGDLLAQLVEGLSSLVSTNKDILKYTKVS